MMNCERVMDFASNIHGRIALIGKKLELVRHRPCPVSSKATCFFLASSPHEIDPRTAKPIPHYV